MRKEYDDGKAIKSSGNRGAIKIRAAGKRKKAVAGKRSVESLPPCNANGIGGWKRSTLYGKDAQADRDRRSV
jgi:hypothetical protein